MSFFQEMINEFKQEIQKEMAVLDIRPDKQAQQPVPASSMPANMGRAPANTGVRISDSSSPKKQRKKAPQKKSATTATRPQAQKKVAQQTQQQTQVQAQPVTTGHAQQLVANLNPQTARNAIIMAEVIGPPVSKRQRKRL